jgi:trehalose 6-phosphate phosphatase
VTVLEELVAAAPEAGIFCDFDGCLAPIVADPQTSQALPGALSALASLARRFRVVAIVSGRSAADLASRVRADGVWLVGLHGMEELRGDRVWTVPEAEAARETVQRVAERLERELAGVPGAVVEPKGLALAVHFRRADDPLEAELRATPVVVAAAEEAGLAVVPGRLILEVRPHAGGDKGDALRRIITSEGLRAAMVAGDDVGDIPAFEALGALETAVRVAVASPESPPELAAGADLVLGSPEEFVRLLEELAAPGRQTR